MRDANEAISGTNLPQKAYQQLQDLILGGKLSAGQPLKQESLSQRFGISRVPIREALTRLEAEGLVQFRPRYGYSVASLNVSEIREIFELMAVVEGHAAFVATQARQDADVHRVQALLKKLDKLEIGGSTSIAKWSITNREFHQALFSASRRQHLLRTTERLRLQVERYVRVELRMTGHYEVAQEEHHRIVAAFIAGDAETVRDLSHQHCEHTMERLLQALVRNRPDSTAIQTSEE